MNRNDIIDLLRIDSHDEIEALFSQARKVREQQFSNKIFLYGFVYFSTWCRNDCAFCYYRKSNPISRYRKEPEEIITIAENLAESGVHLLDLTMGEDLTYHRDRFKSLLEIISQMKTRTGLPVMLSPGLLEDSDIQQFADLGVEWYALYQETHNRSLYANLRLDQDYDRRMHAKLFAKEKGMLIEEGILSGVGETPEDIADSILEMGKIGAAQMRVMSFVPQMGIPMEGVRKPSPLLEEKIIAILRLMYPEVLIPASLDIDGIGGLEDRLNAGANVVTSIIPPKAGLAGVAQNSMDVDEGGRTVKETAQILENLGLQAATAPEYQAYLKRLKTKV